MKAQDLNWLRDGSVNLLTLDLGRWTDITVVPDKRVGDLVRELPAARSADALTLNDGLSIARRAGAGMLVMGDFFKLGKGARIVANVFDVRTGAKVRSITQQTSEADSLLTAFAPLARGVLAVPVPPNEKTGELGTQRLDAYQEYLLGVRALNRFDLEQARPHLNQALTLDSTFALAHYQLSLALEWSESSLTANENRVHALAAQRLGTSLPPRERALINIRVAEANSEYARECELAAPLVARDSTDVQALYALGECAYHDDTVDPGPLDTVPGKFRWGWNVSRRAFSRVLEVDPAFHLAFQHLLDILMQAERFGCAKRAGDTRCAAWNAVVLRAGDSLVMQPVSMTANRAGYERQVDQSAREHPLAANLLLAKNVGERWVAADSASSAAQFGLASALLRLGDITGADAHLRRMHTVARAGDFPEIRAHMEVAIKLGRGAEARAWLDSLVKVIPDAPGVVLDTRGPLDAIFGRLKRSVAAFTGREQRNGPEAVAWAREVPATWLGLERESAARAEAAYLASMRDTATCRGDCRLGRVTATLLYGMNLKRASWPDFGDTKDPDYLLDYWLSRGDTAALRKGAQYQDSSARRYADIGVAVNAALFSAEAFLALHDSAAALRVTRFYVDTVIPPMSIVAPSRPFVWARMMLLRADLAAAARSNAEARTWYMRILDLWADADPELQPTITRIRAALASL